MSIVETILFAWLFVGFINVLQAWLKGILTAGLIEILFFFFLWPLQALFWILVGVHNGIEALYSFIAGERNKS